MHLSYSELADQLQQAEHPLAILPVGCYEQHGPILPLACDSLIAEALARQLAQRLGPDYHAHVFPTVHFTPTEPNRNFCGTIHVSNQAARAYFAEVLASLLRHPFSAVLIVNGHGSVDHVLKEESFNAVYAQFSQRQTPVRPILVLNAFEFSGAIQEVFGQSPGRHAEWTELLLTLHLLGRDYYTPERLRRLEKFAQTGDFHHPQPAVLGIPMELRSVDGVHGSPLPPNYPNEDLESQASLMFELLAEQMELKARRELQRFSAEFAAAVDHSAQPR